MLAGNGALADMISAGARILECSCGPCIGMGQSPLLRPASRFAPSTATSRAAAARRTLSVYLVSPETAAVSALTGTLTDPRSQSAASADIRLPDRFLINDNMFDTPSGSPDRKPPHVEVLRGPNIKPFPRGSKRSARIDKRQMYP
jgi:aconitate hydratase